MKKSFQITFIIFICFAIIFLIIEQTRANKTLANLHKDIEQLQYRTKQLDTIRERIDATIESDLKTLRTFLESFYGDQQYYPDLLSQISPNLPVHQGTELNFSITERWPTNNKGKDYRLVATHVLSDFNYFMISGSREIVKTPKSKMGSIGN